jgi:hypothetical protein
VTHAARTVIETQEARAEMSIVESHVLVHKRELAAGASPLPVKRSQRSTAPVSSRQNLHQKLQEIFQDIEQRSTFDRAKIATEIEQLASQAFIPSQTPTIH